MAIYKFRCSSCGHEFEVRQSMTAPPPKECPKCEAPKPEKLVAKTDFQLAGGGWAASNYS